MPSKDPIKDAFTRAKQDIFDLQAQLYALKQENNQLNQILSEIPDILQQQTSLIRDQQAQIREISTKILDSSRQTSTPTSENPAQNQRNQTQNPWNPAHNSSFNVQERDKLPQYILKSPYTPVSTRNGGVPADRQTHQQADKNPNLSMKTDFSSNFSSKIPNYTGNEGVEFPQNPSFSSYSDTLDQLESLRADIKAKFKHLTQQEFTVFAAIYQLEEEGFAVDYPLLASKLHLTESSIRDYSQKLIKKGVPILKTKENNKRIFLAIDPNLKKIASLPSILALREL